MFLPQVFDNLLELSLLGIYCSAVLQVAACNSLLVVRVELSYMLAVSSSLRLVLRDGRGVPFSECRLLFVVLSQRLFVCNCPRTNLRGK